MPVCVGCHCGQWTPSGMRAALSPPPVCSPQSRLCRGERFASGLTCFVGTSWTFSDYSLAVSWAAVPRLVLAASWSIQMLLYSTPHNFPLGHIVYNEHSSGLSVAQGRWWALDAALFSVCVSFFLLAQHACCYYYQHWWVFVLSNWSVTVRHHSNVWVLQ